MQQNDSHAPIQDRFAHGANGWPQDPRITSREIAMVALINDVTDEKDWHIKVFDDDWVAQQKEVALKQSLISPTAWEWCLAEIRDKVSFFEKTKLVQCLDTGSSVYKSDGLVAEVLHAGLDTGLRAFAIGRKREKPASIAPQEKFNHIIDPSLFPLVYGKTAVLEGDSIVRLDVFLQSLGEGKPYKMNTSLPNAGEFDGVLSPSEATTSNDDLRWSKQYQWLPCEVEFSRERGSDVRIISYINNLHPEHHRALYHFIEKLVSVSIEPWNQCLLKMENPKRPWSSTDPKPQSGRVPLRIRTYGMEWQPSHPSWAKNQNLTRLQADKRSSEYQEARMIVREYLELPQDEPFDKEGNPKHWFTADDDVDMEEWEGYSIENQVYIAWEKKYHYLHPEPGTAFSYDEWRRGENGRAIFDRVDHSQHYFEPYEPPQDADHEYYSIKLEETFRQQGLQVIVKVTSIDLTPESPDYASSEWYFEAQLNEHIVATTAYYYDVENIEESRVSFRQQTTMCENEYIWQPTEFVGDGLAALAGIFAFEFKDEYYAPKTQEIGSVTTQQGRIVSWPNVMQHRVEPFALADRSKPGHRRVIVLYLVDPHYRIPSTKTVPPQQHDWWIEAALARRNFASDSKASTLPQEVLDLVDAETEDWPMGSEEAESIKREVERNRAEAFRAVDKAMPTFMFEDGFWGP